MRYICGYSNAQRFINHVDTESFTHLLLLSISPVAIISGIGLLLLSITNRLGRVIDRVRALASALDEDRGHPARDLDQIIILLRRAKLLRASIVFIVGSIFACCLMIIFLFVLIFAGARMKTAVLFTFGLSVLFVFGAMICFVWDICSSLNALEIEVAHHLQARRKPRPVAHGMQIKLPTSRLRPIPATVQASNS